MKSALLVFAMTTASGSTLFAHPYRDPAQVPRDSDYRSPPPPKIRRPTIARGRVERGLAALRIGVRFDPSQESYSVARVMKEYTGTSALRERARQRPRMGSYIASLRNRASGEILAYDNIGTGKEYRRLADEITFRFPLPPDIPLEFELLAENPESGAMESVLKTPFALKDAALAQPSAVGVEIREIRKSREPRRELRMNIYAEGYTDDRREVFWQDAERAVAALVQNGFPGIERLHFFAVFAPSRERLGSAADFGTARISRDTALNLFFPYWNKFGRWYDVLYPASEERFRLAAGVAPYDYILALADEGSYWGIGNFRVLTAVPAHHQSFIYLLLHELGHFFGLNEEYDDGGRTELEFAPGLAEPWSQNITFHPLSPKWTALVRRDTPLPTPNSKWSTEPPVYGAYAGGYAQSPPLHRSHKPGLNCLMDRAQEFCDVCRQGIANVMEFDSGPPSN